MKNYIIKPKSTKKSIIQNKRYSFGAFSYRRVESINPEIEILKNLIIDKKKWFEPWSDAYIPFSENYFIRISEMDDLWFTFTISDKTNKIVPPEKTRQIIRRWDICYQTASNVGNVCVYDGPDAYYNSHIIRLNLKKKWYVFAFLKSTFCRNQVEVWWSIKGVDNFTEDFLLDTFVPFPTIKNHNYPEQVEEYISLLVQNMIDKEEQIRSKNEQIDKMIERELLENQKNDTFEYRFPRISEIREEGRLDTGLYREDYKKIDFSVRNYNKGFYPLLKKYKATRWQNLQISNIGESIYSDVEKPNFYRLFTNVELTDSRTISSYRWLWNKNNLTLIPQKTIFLSADGTVWRCIYISNPGNTITNIHPWNINRINPVKEEYEDILIAMFLGYLYKKSFFEKIKDKANGWGIKLNHLEKYIKIPNFPTDKQQEISGFYFNPVPENVDLDLKSYLTKEKVRNSKIWIFQLNMEVLELREKLEDLVDAIVMERKIEITL